jgi:hypothetical protein
MQEVRHSKYTTAENLTSWLNVIGYLTKMLKKKLQVAVASDGISGKSFCPIKQGSRRTIKTVMNFLLS